MSASTWRLRFTCPDTTAPCRYAGTVRLIPRVCEHDFKVMIGDQQASKNQPDVALHNLTMLVTDDVIQIPPALTGHYVFKEFEELLSTFNFPLDLESALVFFLEDNEGPTVDNFVWLVQKRFDYEKRHPEFWDLVSAFDHSPDALEYRTPKTNYSLSELRRRLRMCSRAKTWFESSSVEKQVQQIIDLYCSFHGVSPAWELVSRVWQCGTFGSAPDDYSIVNIPDGGGWGPRSPYIRASGRGGINRWKYYG